MENNENLIQFDSNISTDNDETRIAFFANIGFFIEVAQMLEFNLRKLICYHRSVTEIEATELTAENVQRICQKYDAYYFKTYEDKYTLGRLKGELDNCGFLKQEIVDFFDEINEYRIMIVHKIFQNNIITDGLKEADAVNKYTQKRLIPMTNKTIEINRMVINIMNEYKTDLRSYKKQVNITVEE